MLLAKLAGAMKGTMSKAAALFQAPLSKAARTVQALADKREQESGSARNPAARPNRPALHITFSKGTPTWRS